MTKQEALDKIKELQDFVENMDVEVGYKDDEIFLLSADEYKRYESVIANWISWCWLRSFGKHDDYAAYVTYDGLISECGYNVNIRLSIRPAIKVKGEIYAKITKTNGVLLKAPDVGDRIIMYDFPFICIDCDKGLFIAEVLIAYDIFDEESNDYENSHIRKFLKDWKESRS